MSPWSVLEWSIAIGLSVIVAFVVIVAIILSARAILGKTNPKRTRKPVQKKPAVNPAPTPVAAKKTAPTIKK